MAVMQLDDIRDKIAAIRTSIRNVEGARLPQDEAIHRLHTWVEHQGEAIHTEAFRNFALDNRHAEAAMLDTLHAQLETAHGASKSWQLMCRLMPDAVIAAAEAELALAYAAYDGPVLGREERGTRLTELKEELFRLEVVDEQLVMEKEASGEPVMRRADADPRAVLEVLDPW